MDHLHLPKSNINHIWNFFLSLRWAQRSCLQKINFRAQQSGLRYQGGGREGRYCIAPLYHMMELLVWHVFGAWSGCSIDHCSLKIHADWLNEHHRAKVADCCAACKNLLPTKIMQKWLVGWMHWRRDWLTERVAYGVASPCPQMGMRYKSSGLWI